MQRDELAVEIGEADRVMVDKRDGAHTPRAPEPLPQSSPTPPTPKTAT